LHEGERIRTLVQVDDLATEYEIGQCLEKYTSDFLRPTVAIQYLSDSLRSHSLLCYLTSSHLLIFSEAGRVSTSKSELIKPLFPHRNSIFTGRLTPPYLPQHTNIHTMNTNDKGEYSCDVSRLNNWGASFIQSENFPEAISCLSVALKLAKATSKSLQQDPSAVVPNDAGTKMRVTLDCCMELSSSSNSNSSNLPLKCDDTSSFVFGQPIFMPAHPAAYLVVSDRLCDVSAMIVFNLALAYQLQSEVLPLPWDCKLSSSQLIQKSIALYNLAGRLVSTSEPPIKQGGGEGRRGDILFTLTVSNNLVHAHGAVGEYDVANRFGQFLHSFLLARSASGCENGIPHDMAELFLTTVLHVMQQRNAPASAA
jgi:hypothetical protein